MKTKATTPEDGKNKENVSLLEQDDRHHMISEAAYYMAESKGFCGDYTLQNWLDAEAQINKTNGLDKHCA